MVSQEFWKKDGPFSWVILVTIVLSRFAGIGFSISTAGVFSDAYPVHFGAPQAETNVIGATVLGVFLFTVPLNTILMRIIGVRRITIIGTVLNLVGVFPAAFVTKVWHLLLCYGVVASVGMSMCAAGTLGIVRHYFDRRQGAAFAGIGLGAGIAQVSLPPICSTLSTKYGYKYAWLYISPLFLINLLPPLLFIEQIPLNKPKSAKALLTSYVAAFKHYITPFFLLNSLFARGAQLGILVLLFGHLSITTTPEIALKAYVVCGFGFLVSTLSCNLILLKFNLNCFVTLIVINLAIGLTCCMLAAFNIPLVYYIFCGIFGLTNGAALAVKGGVSIHVYPPDAIEYSYGLSEAVAGIGSFVFPYVGGYIQKQYSNSSSGIYFHAAAVTLGGLILILAALIRPALWKLPQHRHTKPEKSDEDFTTSRSESSEHSSESTADIHKENPLGQCKVTGLVGRGI